MNDLAADWNQVRATFKKIWGYEDFRPPQGEIIQTLLNAKDALIVMPTGGGKSICFQLPALLKSGLTLVISPLVALMENQVQELQQLNLSAALLHNEIPRSQRKKTLQALEKQQLKLLYLSPETLLSTPIWERLSHPQVKINGIILDEAHCLVNWGDTFRPVYRRLGTVRPALLQSKPPGTKIAIAAFTATANPQAQGIITEVLQLQTPETFLISPYRNNLNLRVKITVSPGCRRHQLLKFIQSQGKQAGLVYVRSRKDSENLSEWLRTLNYSTAAYHAGLSSSERRYIETGWLNDDLQFVVCTSAFGMGINKSNVRWVIHFQAPQLLSEYLQEVGRGGRDGKSTEALTLMSEPTGWLDPTDQQQWRFFANKLAKQYQQAQQIANKIPAQGEIQTIAEALAAGDISLGLLHSLGQVEWLDPFQYQLKFKNSSALNQSKNNSQQTQFEMKRYLNTKRCRWQFLLNAFGFIEEATGFKCGHCDNCR
ncbi:RecQ family ATP-dependent DNA helicase [Gloeothece verrucosa]|uniref:ATP-dependent DNA helicase RecQ n=1 Tax=Gloeothece verrucosa (strain PCC 7822) TaxID=497965 RepID=E0U5I6_GLOV7|nr:RecQ family ATP-dependent DNA helicase [Gloeothece verrucosa]ADN14699.1 ATP-dependent DNA helicase, RecQ family [Gloeothece verrucosa PCC 7822]